MIKHFYTFVFLLALAFTKHQLWLFSVNSIISFTQDTAPE